MALSAELMHRLEGDEPLPKRLKLAENAYCSTDLSINHKEEGIIDWLCNIVPTNLVAWNTLYLCLHCQSANSRSTLLRRVKIRVIDTLIAQLKISQDNNPLEKIFDCCKCILNSFEMQQFFQHEINKLGLLLKYIFSRIKVENDNNVDFGKNPEIQNCILSGIDCLSKLLKQNTDKDKIAETFLNYVLYPLCALIDPNCKDSSNRIGAETHKCMQQILFTKGRYTEYKEYFNAKDKEGVGFLPNKLFKTIAKQRKVIGDNNAQNVVDFVFYAVVGSYKTDSLLIDNFFREFVNISGDLKTVVLNSLVKHLTDVPLEYGNKIDDITLIEFFGNLIEDTLNKRNISDNEYSLLSNIAVLNPLVVENKLPLIFKRILLEDRKNATEKESYISLMIAILDASSKLRREQKFIPWILLALHEALEENKKCALSATEILPTEFTLKFNDFARCLNSSQVVAMLKSLTFHLKSNCVGEYENGAKNHVSLMAECTVSLLVSFIHGIPIFEHTVPLPMQIKFVATLRELGEVLSDLADKILHTKHDERMTIVLLEATLAWGKMQSAMDYYVPDCGAGNIEFSISENNLQQLIQRAENFGDKGCKNALNIVLFDRLSLNLHRHKPSEKLTGIIGKLDDYWQIILSDYPELISLLDIDQLLEFASLILEDIIANDSQKWQETFEKDGGSESKEFIIAILCHTLIKIGSLMGSSASAAIASRINLTKILQDITNDAPVPALDRKRLIKDIIQLPNLSEEGSSMIKKCLETLLSVPVMFLSVPLRTMTFVMIYVIGKECQLAEGLKDICEKILFETLEEGGLNIFDYMDPQSLISDLRDNIVLERVFKMSLRNAEPSVSLEHLSNSLYNCPGEAAPAVLSCIDNLKSKLNNEQRIVLNKVEKKLGKKLLSDVEKDLESVQKTKKMVVALNVAIGRNQVKKDLKKSVISTLQSIFVIDEDVENREENLTEENEKSDGKNKLMKEGFELARIALQNRSRLDLSEELVFDIWAKVLRCPDARLLTPLLEASSPKMFNIVLMNLHKQTEMELRENDIARLNQTVGIWNSIFVSDMGARRNKFRLNAVHKLLQSLQMVDIQIEHWPNLIKLLTAMTKARHMQLSGEHTDCIIMTAFRSLRDGGFPVCDEVLTLCVTLLRSKTEMMSDRLPILLILYKKSVSLITQEAKKKDVTNRHQLALSALNLEKVTSALVKLKRDMLRLCPYILAELVSEFVHDDLEESVKESYKNCFNNLSSICDSHAPAFLLRALPSDKRELYKGLNETYNKFHRFTGKI